MILLLARFCLLCRLRLVVLLLLVVATAMALFRGVIAFCCVERFIADTC